MRPPIASGSARWPGPPELLGIAQVGTPTLKVISVGERPPTDRAASRRFAPGIVPYRKVNGALVVCEKEGGIRESQRGAIPRLSALVDRSGPGVSSGTSELFATG
jgi:hypothetical protein